eukprot:scaffold21666_cov85-Isochrysis_galbana.AAC.3
MFCARGVGRSVRGRSHGGRWGVGSGSVHQEGWRARPRGVGEVNWGQRAMCVGGGESRYACWGRLSNPVGVAASACACTPCV